MKKILTVIILAAVVLTAVAVPVEAKTVKTVKGKQAICCPYCGDGTHMDCPYWYIDMNGHGKHMTTKQIIKFCEMEAR